ncbi:M12 family metallo-peptidase [Tamlana sp. 62-3]|uniref:M12 family metallo-peptidase n=1 Tax=Neotamlana sargassicola TaxID=2883125 RepID=A0A9X1I484_9FLAO|nr:zinc-dependent metalloprotease family protein [Tamlana sargassicola]MCB4807467.1 M12 family metallo-peptidase [Tamlana sargassicola]
MKTNLRYVLSIAMLLTIFSASGQAFFLKKESSQSKTSNNLKSVISGSVYQFDNTALSQYLQKQSAGLNKEVDLTLMLPDSDDNLVEYIVEEASVMHPDLQAKYPEIRSYVGYQTNNPSVVVRFSLSPNKGFTGLVLGGEQTLTMLPDENNSNLISVKNKSDLLKENSFLCKTIDNFKNQTTQKSGELKDADDSQKRTYRIAISVTGEYAAYHGGTLSGVNAALAASLTNVNAIFENEFNVSLQLIANNDDIIYLNASTDPYSNINNYNSEVANVMNTEILDANYDVGHLLATSTGYDGDAGCIGCVCNNGGTVGVNHKGSAFTASETPGGVIFDVDLFAHELGHQLGASHTWTFGGNEGFNSQMEPGSGSTIMGYAGIAGSYNVQANSDAYFHAISIDQVVTTIQGTSCATITNTGNTTPTANAGPDLILPIGTAFKLIGSSSDADGDAITYCWEQFNENNAATTLPNSNSTNSNSVLFRSFAPTTSSERYFPNLKDLKFGIEANKWEKVPNVNRTVDFRLTVRDNKPGGANNTHDDMVVTFSTSYGPFEITSQNTTGIVWTGGSTETITWNVNNTNSLTGASNVNILLSTDGGVTYTEIANNIPNNGSYSITVPNTPSPYCRIMIEPTNNYFFAINTEDFAIDYSVGTTCSTYNSSSNLNLTITDNTGSFSQSSSIFIGDSGVIEDLNIGIDITHPYIGDLVIALTSPDGTTKLLKSFDDCSNEDDMLMVFNDNEQPLDCSDSASNKSYESIRSLLSSFNGENLNGNWTLSLGDFGNGDVGTLNSWYVEVCETTETQLDVEDFEIGDLKVYPNPNKGEFTVQLGNSESDFLNLKVVDVRGRVIYKNTLENRGYFKEIIQLKTAQTGVYFLSVDDGKNQSIKKLIVK